MASPSIERTVEQFFDRHFKPQMPLQSTAPNEVHLLVGDTLFDLSDTMSSVHARLSESVGEPGLLPDRLDASQVALGLTANWLASVIDGVQPDAVAVFSSRDAEVGNAQLCSYTLQCRGSDLTTQHTEEARPDASGDYGFTPRVHENVAHDRVDCAFRDLYAIDSRHRPFVDRRIEAIDLHARSISDEILGQLHTDLPARAG